MLSKNGKFSSTNDPKLPRNKTPSRWLRPCRWRRSGGALPRAEIGSAAGFRPYVSAVFKRLCLSLGTGWYCRRSSP